MSSNSNSNILPKWSTLGGPLKNHPNATYSFPTRTMFNADTGTYVAHPTWSNDAAAQDRERAHVYTSGTSTGLGLRGHGGSEVTILLVDESMSVARLLVLVLVLVQDATINMYALKASELAS
ncbi:hypothetical protein AYO21_09751 [Fonsecaea monophora]|uniref:Uncharacterized protein n=1 Tax=Fonsecaea monophora TaxID=254056 RepID=A0A177EVH3_9EURO|nr:hypothetical protein AYO21_09751 [Fonsecaea monophora]OAG36033.1 hypothetical protein AYO21_09751 [Fonsecaea monophora]